jgi:hypothetical protein
MPLELAEMTSIVSILSLEITIIFISMKEPLFHCHHRFKKEETDMINETTPPQKMIELLEEIAEDIPNGIYHVKLNNLHSNVVDKEGKKSDPLWEIGIFKGFTCLESIGSKEEWNTLRKFHLAWMEKEQDKKMEHSLIEQASSSDIELSIENAPY